VKHFAAQLGARGIRVNAVATKTVAGRDVALSMQALKRLACVDQCLREHANRELTTYAASTAKLWITEMYGRVVDRGMSQ
jgi:enoyl-[acyl-carrier-protein] reductase (NADH)